MDAFFGHIVGVITLRVVIESRYFLNESREGCLNATKQSLSL